MNKDIIIENIIENGDEPIIAWSTSSGKYICLDNDGDRIRVLLESIDKLIEALQQIKGEINNAK